MDVSIIKEVRRTQPLIHNITNAVVMNFSANGLLAFGGSPIMANAKDDVADVAWLSKGLLINIGTLTDGQVESMVRAGKAANEVNIPVVLDPVGVAATKFRTQSFQHILKEVRPAAIKGNEGELGHLVGIEVETKGVESIGTGNGEEIARKVAEKYKTTAVLTGKVDVISDGSEIVTNTTGHPMLAKVTGAGCLLGSILAATLSVSGSVMDKSLAALEFYGLAAERAAANPTVHGPGTFVPAFIDALAMEESKLEEFTR
ncbi:hydroxyethylthiazole kinase [Halobacillus sp. BBL2006]|uniref:hydroxyethylthiazole kinase n=1 Tax=Halobacillus sp. BBL2006 TaxID=1543706 RepID=UPI000543B8D3|nr:hydroxyethylthiazole kinase [Halobacillus sp. BBL2006]KHE72574.1 hydroxyethylthiazole kinase [Halobacillus sp. BBL2006]